MVICLAGSCKFLLDTGKEKVIDLNTETSGLFVDKWYGMKCMNFHLIVS